MEKRVWPQDISNSDDYLAMEKKIFSSFKNKISEGWLIVHMDDIVRSNYCPDGVFNDKSFGYDGKTLRQVIQEIREIEKLKLGIVINYRFHVFAYNSLEYDK